MELYKCECLKGNAKVLKGMNVEIITSTGYPKSDNIKIAVERKYDISLSYLSIDTNQWDCVKIS